MSAPDHLEGREHMLRALREELVGPAPRGPELDCSGPLAWDDFKEAQGPFRQLGTGDEILIRQPPARRYGVGVLYPIGSPLETEAPADDEHDVFAFEEHQKDEGPLEPDEMALRDPEAELEPDDFDLSTANAFKPSSMAISFLARFTPDSTLVVEVPCFHPVWKCPVNGRYRRKEVTIGGKPFTWWLREQVELRAEFGAGDLCGPSSGPLNPCRSVESKNLDGLDLRIEVISRPTTDPQRRLVTVALVNRNRGGRISDDEGSLFQAYFRASVTGEGAAILPYREAAAHPDLEERLDQEEASLDLLYREYETFATGHGCSADWDKDEDGTVRVVRAECLPICETPSITPDIQRPDGTTLKVSMAALAGLVPGDEGFSSLEEVVDLYEKWLDERRRELAGLPQRHQRAASVHLKRCEEAANRMRDGIAFLRSDPVALRAFQLANHAVLLQQLRVSPEARQVSIDKRAARVQFSEPYPEVQHVSSSTARGYWRPFQIAFLLMSIRSTACPDAHDRRTVELIWFPTGGGKTEAYLGLTAFSIFLRRLRDPNDKGVQVLMRYTLRLLTAQQFQRAAALLCAMEYLRRHNEGELGPAELSIGIWLGSTTTPNSRDEAVKYLRDLQRDLRGPNPFLLTRCPWCNAQIGPLKQGRASTVKVLGYRRDGDSVVLHCTDDRCDFSAKLPVYVVDEDIYEYRPALVIGTVDKFAMLAWRPKARTLFGIGEEGNRVASPPGLIIQDELHLISGPLGSVAGIYETVIEELCTDRRFNPAVSPKIVCSTATIRRYEEQITSLYGRSKVALFPPPGLDASDSFFSRYAQRPDGKLCSGRIYVGVHGAGLRSMQTVQVRAFTALLQAPMSLDAAARDPWWTLLVFFNSLRELGTTKTLLQSDIIDYRKVLKRRMGLERSDMRQFWNILELTSRMRGDEVPEAIAALSVPCTSETGRPVDVALASSIIEVGVDIDRLSLMCIVGQPKSTSQYIQVSGRIGRQWRERPGLVVTLYSPTKPRDRSHFEKFRSYHERLYAQVEPTSVTPFSPPVLDRFLHAIMVSYVRQAGTSHQAQSPQPYPEQLLTYLRNLILQRVRLVDPLEERAFLDVFERRSREWRDWQRITWQASNWTDDPPLLRQAGSYVDAQYRHVSWPTPQSMRNVDAECRASISYGYLDTSGGKTDE